MSYESYKKEEFIFELILSELLPWCESLFLCLLLDTSIFFSLHCPKNIWTLFKIMNTLNEVLVFLNVLIIFFAVLNILMPSYARRMKMSFYLKRL